MKSALWYGNNLPVPLGGDKFSTCPVAELAVSLVSRNLSEETGQLDDAEPPPPLLSSSCASADGVRWDESSSSASTYSAAESEVANSLAVSREEGSASFRLTRDADENSHVRAGVGANRVCSCCGSAMDCNQASWDHVRAADYCCECGREPLCRSCANFAWPAEMDVRWTYLTAWAARGCSGARAENSSRSRAHVGRGLLLLSGSTGRRARRAGTTARDPPSAS